MRQSGSGGTGALFVAALTIRRPQALNGPRVHLRLAHLRSSLNHSTPLAIAMHTPHCSSESGAVPKARFRGSMCTTATCRPAESATMAHSHRLANRPLNALRVSDRALKQLKSCASTSTVKPAVRAPVRLCWPSIRPPGRNRSRAVSYTHLSAPAGEVASGRPSPTLLGLFAPSSMVAVPGLNDADPHADFRADVCGLANGNPAQAQKIAFMHQVLQRDVTDVRLFLDHLEQFTASITPAPQQPPEVRAALARIEGDHGPRERFLEFARDADEATVQARMMALARTLGWLTPAQEQAEFMHMIARRMGRGSLSHTEVDLVCSRPSGGERLDVQRPLVADAARPGDLSHAAVLACLGDPGAHGRTVQALSSPRDEEVAIVQIYLRHRPLAGVAELRAVTSNIGRMGNGQAQLRALETLARQRLADAQSLQEIADLFPLARSLEVQRAIAGVLIRSDYRLLARADLARTLGRHRLKSPGGSDVIDVLIRLLRSG